jgi:DNA-binding NtrC family response regulator
MQTSPDLDLTLPSIMAAMPANRMLQRPVLTIAFHPDTARIGHRAVVPEHTDNAHWILGRCSPEFIGPGEKSSSPLDNQHISRRAVQFVYRNKCLTIHRFQAASRCRIGQAELYDSVELSWDQLRVGVPVLLAHSIVLMLRLGPVIPPAEVKSGIGAQLRGNSAAMVSTREQVARAANSDLDVLLRGETGTGKELAAAAIHTASRRAGEQMVRVNMAAIPSELAAAALFGSARGAFTGAKETTRGYFEQAAGGSLFLDEIGDAAPQVQPQLLRALQQREVQAVGGSIRKVDVRVISATDAAIDAEGSGFKSALRHRLGAVEIVLPALREHPEDVGELLLYFLQKSAEEVGRTDLLPNMQSPASHIAAWAVLFLQFCEYSWPGNVRELSNFAQQVVLASNQAPVLNDNLGETLVAARKTEAIDIVPPVRRRIQDVDDDTFDDAMASNDFEVPRVARFLDVSRAAVYRRIEASSRYRLISEIPLEELQRTLKEHKGDDAAAARKLRVPLSGFRRRLRKLETG